LVPAVDLEGLVQVLDGEVELLVGGGLAADGVEVTGEADPGEAGSARRKMAESDGGRRRRARRRADALVPLDDVARSSAAHGLVRLVQPTELVKCDGEVGYRRLEGRNELVGLSARGGPRSAERTQGFRLLKGTTETS